MLRNYEGVTSTYNQPMDYKDDCQCDDCLKETKDGIAGLLAGDRISLEPQNLNRKKRKNKNKEV